MNIKLFVVLGVSALYVVIRYMVFGDVDFDQLPAFLVNKWISLSAVAALVIAATAFAHGPQDAYRFWIRIFGHLSFLHILLSLALLSEGNYPKFFSGGRMSLTGEGMLFFGLIAAYCFWRVGSLHHSRWKIPLTLLASALLGAHLVVMGLSGWLTIGKWQGGLPPISLLSCLLVVASFILFFRGRSDT